MTLKSQQTVVHFVLTPEETALLNAGEYSIVASFNSERGSSKLSWKGNLSTASRIFLMDRQSAAAPAAACDMALNSSEYFHVLGREKEGIQALDDALKNAPPGTAWACMEKRASIAESTGDLAGARDLLCRAASEFRAWILTRKKETLTPSSVHFPAQEHCERLTALLKK
ncbi:hypothetical protein [Myxococcus stipitatus]|uniref:hypothetical protein n=1 Tax=Myxococcus stipitatus TaxID=83455 RepID=UPI001186F279|nr:hypothetical protein [Myxococcus stipitatus]